MRFRNGGHTTAINAKGGDSKMLTFLMISRHTAADCPAHNAENRKVVLEAFSKAEELGAKYGIKTVGIWNVHSEHLTVQVVEAPSMEAFMAMSMEPSNIKLLNFETAEWKLAQTGEELMQAMMQAQ
jgi:uncharacterized protein with GYD domain